MTLIIINYYFESYICVNNHSHILVRHVISRWWGGNKMKGINFITFISSRWHPWLMTKWHEHPIVITMIKKWFEVVWYEHKQPHTPPTYVPTYWPTYPPTHLSTYLLNYLPTKPPTYHLFITYLFTYPPMHPPTYLPTHILTYPLTHIPTSPTYLLINLPFISYLL
jgi:hypothetical protein